MLYKSLLILFLFLSISSCASHKTPIIRYKTPSQKATHWIKPPPLKKGDTVAIVSPAGYLYDSIHTIQNGLDSLRSWGLAYKIYPHTFDRYIHFAGKDTDRATDFQEAMNNPNIKAIWCSRGGYGSVRMIDQLDYSVLKKHPKWIIGFSDITAIHNDLHNTGIQSIHGIMPLSFRNPTPKRQVAISTLKNILFGTTVKYSFTSNPYNRTGSATGVLVGGNLSILQSLLESKSSIDTRGKIIFLEEVGEKKYQIDRMLYSLKRAGYFDQCKALIVGGISGIKDDDDFDIPIEDIFLQVLKEYKFPIVFNFPAGHIYNNKALIFGSKVKVTVRKQKTTLRFLE